jgi:hypothetical protein
MDGPMKGTRALQAEHDQSWALLKMLSDREMKLASCRADAPAEIITGNTRKAAALDPIGISYAQMSPAVQKAFVALIGLHASTQQAALADAPNVADPRGRPRLCAIRVDRCDNVSAGRRALLPDSGAHVPDRVRQHAEQRQPSAHRVARLQRRLRHGPARRTLRRGSDSQSVDSDRGGGMASYSRRDFGRLLGMSGAAVAMAPSSAWARARSLEDLGGLGVTSAPLPQATGASASDEAVLAKSTRAIPRAARRELSERGQSLSIVAGIDRGPRKDDEVVRNGTVTGGENELFAKGKEESRKLMRLRLRVTPEEIVITRNTTEANNLVSSGLDLKAGDEVIVWADNHPSNLAAWQRKAQRFGFTVVTAPLVPSHPGTDGYVDLFTKLFTPRTKLVAITHVNSNSGDLLPAAEICAAARSRGVLSLVDAAQSFGVLDNDLSAMKPDFFTGSLHKWPCGPKEKGVLFASLAVHDRIQPSIVGVYGGAVGLSRTFETNGQRDDSGFAAWRRA